MMLFFVATAMAQTPTVADVVLAATPAMPEGFGAPSVVWDGTQWRMYAETQVVAPAGCAEAWSVVRSTSTDGLAWTSPVQVQGPSTVTACGARRPSAVWTDAGTWAVVWEAVGTLVPKIGVTHNTLGARRSRLLGTLNGLVEPSLVRFDGVWHVFAIEPGVGIVEATSTDLRTFTAVAGPLVAIGATPWSTDGVENPSFSCIDDATWPFSFGFGGWAGPDTSWTVGVVRDTGAVYVEAPRDTWPTVDAWAAFDVVDDGTDLGVWIETVDPMTGLPAIGLSGAVPVGASVPGRDCMP